MLSFRVPRPTRDRLTELAERQGLKRSELLNRIVDRYIENYPENDDN